MSEHIIKITDVQTSDPDNLLVFGTVDNVTCQGHGWQSRVHSLNGEETTSYFNELLLNGMPASADELRQRVGIIAVQPNPAASWIVENRFVLLAVFVAVSDAAILILHFWR